MISDPDTVDGPEDLPRGLPPTLGPCRLLHKLGSGGMASVYLAEMVEGRPYAPAGSRVAVKVVHPERLAGYGAFKRFLREAAVGKSIAHPAVVRTYDADAFLGGSCTYHYLVLEYVEGQNLRELIQQLGLVPEALLRHLARQIAAGLDAVHAAGVVHRDLKPANVLITPDHQVKVMDLGLASLLEESVRLTLSDHFLGTALYASPEQFTGSRVGPSTDLYSLGVMLFEAATGRRPFEAATVLGLMRKHADEAPPKVGQLNPRLSPFLEEVVSCLLEKSADRRFASAAELASVLEAGEESPWWRERERALRAAHPRGRIRRVRVPREIPLVGRSEELEALDQAFAEAGAGRGKLVLIEGEAGVGKTRLLDEFLWRAEGEGEPRFVLCASFGPGGVGTGPGALARAVVGHFGEAALGDALGRYLPLIPRLVPAFTAYLGGEPSPAGSEALSMDAVHTAFCHLARGLAAESPTVWIVEDLHFAPADSRALLLSLARVAHDQRLLLLVTTRPGLAAEDLAHLERLPLTRRLNLGRLSAREVIQLLQETFKSASLAEALGGKVAFKSDGNPFFVLEMVRALREEHVLEQSGDGSYVATRDIAGIGVPSSVRDLLFARLTDLSDDERSLLDVAAVQGFDFDPDLVARVHGLIRLAVLKALAAIERRSGVIRATGAGFQFDHHQLQEVLYEAVPPVLRAEYHALLARSLLDRAGLAARGPEAVPGAAAVVLAGHFLRGGLAGEGLLVLGPALAHLEAGFQHTALTDLVELAIAGLDPADHARRCELSLRQADAYDVLGERAAQRRALERALEAAEAAGDPGLATRTRLALGWLLYSVSDYQPARRLLEDAAEGAAADGDRRNEARALNYLGPVLAQVGSYGAARRHLERSIELARAAGDGRGEANATGNLGNIFLDLARYGEARTSYERQIELCRANADRRGEARALGNLATAVLYLGQHSEAIALLARQLAACAEMGYRRGEAIANGNLGGVYLHLGQLDRAREHFGRHLALARAVGYRQGETIALTNVASVAIEEGRVEDAASGFAQALELSRSLGTRRVEGDVLHGLAAVARARGQGDEAHARLAEELAIWEELDVPQRIAECALALGRNRIERGEESQALRHLIDADARFRGLPTAGGRPLAAAYLALLGERDPASVAVGESAAAAVRAEAHLVLHRAGGGDRHLVEARTLLERLAAHLSATDAEGFWRHNSTARLLRARETGSARDRTT